MDLLWYTRVFGVVAGATQPAIAMLHPMPCILISLSKFAKGVLQQIGFIVGLLLGFMEGIDLWLAGDGSRTIRSFIPCL